MLRININGQELKAYEGQTILEIARTAGIKIPTLCHDDRLKPYGGCGLCVVQREGSGKLIRACATLAEDGMVLFTDTPRLREARKMTLSLLLSDHSGDCRGPCVLACPAQTDVQGYVGLIANGQYRDAVKLIKEKLPIPASIGRICPHPCEDVCRRELVEGAISIAHLKYFAAEQDLNSDDPYQPEVAPATGKSAAIIGAGPAGLTAAYYLAVMGHAVCVYDAMPQGGGMLRYGIPEYRLPKDVLDLEIELIAELGVDFKYNTKIGRDISMDYLLETYDTVFVGIGAWESSAMRCDGENLPGVYGGIDFLRMVAMDEKVDIGKRVAVVGGGNTAMDAARTAVRMGADEVMVLYRRTRAEMPAEDIEIKEAEEEGVIFNYLVAPLEVFESDGQASAIRLQKMELGAPDASGRRSPVPIPGAEEIVQIDSVISAIGQAVDSRGISGIEMDKWGSPKVDKYSMQTSNPKVFAGGDGVTGPGIAITAVAHGRKAALGMDAYLTGKAMPAQAPYLVERHEMTAEDFVNVARVERTHMRHTEPAIRRRNFEEVNLGFSESQAMQEAARCLECGCKDYFECRLIDFSNQYQADPAGLEGEKRRAVIINEHPFIERNTEKCILCSQCIRICEEVMGVTALGLVYRGFESLVSPEFGLPLGQTGCVSCGQCVAVCPTGALVEKYPQVKTIPLDTEKAAAVCTLCALGCEQVVHSYGREIVKVEPVSGGLLCSKGRFAFEYYAANRLNGPMIRNNGELTEVSWEDASRMAERSLRSIRRVNGAQAVAAAISPVLSLEDAGALQSFMQTAMNSDRLFSFTRNTSRGLETVLGVNRSTATLAELQGTAFILQVGSLNQSQMAAVQVRKGVEAGASLVVIAEAQGLNDDIADFSLIPEDGLSFVKEIIAALIKHNLVNKNFIDKYASNYQEMVSSIEGMESSETALSIARKFAGAKKAIIVADGSTISRAGVELLAQMAVICGHINTPRSGIIVVNSDANQLGQWALGVRDCFHMHMDAIKAGAIKALIIAGEDPVGAGLIAAEELSGVECLIVISPYRTATAELAHLVLPMANVLEAGGSFVNYAGRLSNLTPVLEESESPALTDIMENLGAWFDIMSPSYDIEAVRNYLEKPAYMAPGDPVEGRFILGSVSADQLFMPVSLADPVKRQFSQRMQLIEKM